MFGTVVTVAEANSVDVAVVLNERDEFTIAARIARAVVMAKRQEK